jgi:hypothetical protein
MTNAIFPGGIFTHLGIDVLTHLSGNGHDSEARAQMRIRQCEISVACVNILTSVLNAAAGLTASALRQSTRRVIRCLLPVCVPWVCVRAPEQHVCAWSRALVRVGVVWVPTHNARAHAGASTVAGRASGTHVRLAATTAAAA